jgi:hypothetical protein
MMDALNAQLHQAQIGHLNAQTTQLGKKGKTINVPGYGEMPVETAWHYLQGDKPATEKMPDELADKLGVPKGTTFDQYQKIAGGLKPKEEKTKTPEQIAEAALTEKLGRKPSAIELDNEMQVREGKKQANRVQITVAGAQARGASFANERFYDQYDTQTGKTVKVKGNAINQNPDRYLSMTDPNVKSDTTSLVATTKSMDSINAFEKGASNALDLAQKVATDFSPGKYPGINRISQYLQYQSGDPKVKALRNSITTSATEYMKVINAGSGLSAAELSVMGQNRAKEIIEGADNLDSIKRSIDIMKQEMKISGDKMKAQRLEIQNRLKNYGGGAATNDPFGVR